MRAMPRPIATWALLALALACALAAAPHTATAPRAAGGGGVLLQLAPPGEPGDALELTGLVIDSAGRAIAGARIHAYHADASGRYTKERAMDEPHARLAGWITSDGGGRFVIRSVRPGSYPQPLL